MSPRNLDISNQEVIPEVQSDLFVSHEESRFAVGIVAIGNDITPGLENEYQGYTLLRGNVYGKQQNFMPLDELNPDGTETDPDDARSVHFAIIENAVSNPRVVGSMRLIIKSKEHNNALPIEEHYPESFEDGHSPLGSTEASRLIGRHEDLNLQRGLKWILFTAGVSYILDHDLGPVYGAVERSLARGLRMEGMPVTELAEPKFVEEFNSVKLPIRIDITGLARKMETDQPGVLKDMQELTNNFVYSGVAPLSTGALPKVTAA
jgi:N-acyl-L-homoserine lactone synthetase